MKGAREKNKFIVILSFSSFLGGAQIRYLNLFNELLLRKSDYFLVINRKLYEIALEAGRLNKNTRNIIILEIDKYLPRLSKVTNNKYKTINNIKHYFLVKKFRNLRNQIIAIKRFIIYTYKLHQLFKKNKPDYVYAVWVGGMIAWPLKYIHKFKFVYSFMDSGFSSIYPGIKYPLKNERLALRHADVIDFLSKDLMLGVSKRVEIKQKTKKAISPCSFKNYSNLFPIEPKKNIIVFSSRMTAFKNPLLLMESIAEFNRRYKQYSKIKFIFLGDGECIEKMQKFKQVKNLTNVEMLGFVSNPIDYLQVSKIFISIQQTNNYPSQSLLEAMACENAIIASDVGETRKLVTEQEGVLAGLSIEEIVQALVYLLNNEDKRRLLGKQAREKVLKEHNIDRYLEYFLSLERL